MNPTISTFEEKHTKDKNSYNLEKFGISGVKEFVFARPDNTWPSIPLHFHQDSLEITFHHAGQHSYYIGNETFKVESNEIFISFPNEPHYTGMLERKTDYYYMVIDTLNNTGNFLGSNEGAKLANALNAIKTRKFAAPKDLKKRFDRIFSIIEKDISYKQLLLSSEVCCLLHEIINAEKETTKIYSDDISATIKFIDEHKCNLISVKELASLTFLSVSHFKQKFKNQVGIPPAKYIMREKINYSKELLKTKMPITDIAIQLNFSSNQHFSSMFKSYTSITPSEFRKNG